MTTVQPCRLSKKPSQHNKITVYIKSSRYAGHTEEAHKGLEMAQQSRQAINKSNKRSKPSECDTIDKCEKKNSEQVRHEPYKKIES